MPLSRALGDNLVGSCGCEGVAMSKGIVGTPGCPHNLYSAFTRRLIRSKAHYGMNSFRRLWEWLMWQLLT